MGSNLPRPDDLPDFLKPPIVEAVMSVQFTTPPDYREIYAREIWALFEHEFSRVQEQSALEPFFEVFGGPPGPAKLQIKFQPTGPIHNRFWFLGAGDRELLQFQRDRFVHNWRKLHDANNQYPRFEPILTKFERELGTLDDYFKRKG
jgi:uncharacterized protein (TIGR04255 family)